jgi:hypothetical protein
MILGTGEGALSLLRLSLSRDGSCCRISGRSQNLVNQGFANTCAFGDVWVSRDVEPPVGLAVRALGAEVRVCAPPDCAEQLAEMQPC